MMNKQSFVVEDGQNIRIDKAIAGYFDEEYTRSFIQKLIAAGLVFCNSQVVEKPSFLVYSGDEIQFSLPETKSLDIEPEDIPIDIIYEDKDIIIINKQQGISVHPSTTEPSHTLVNALLFHIRDLSSINGVARPGIVHRIDKNTTGLLVIAKNDAAHISLSRQISEKTAKRHYLALVDGNIKEDEGSVNFSLGRDKSNRLRWAKDWAGKTALTDYFVKERFMQYTLVECRLHTGRTHQIRAHLKGINHPIVGDVLYGGSNKFGLNGQLLHAFSLSFFHPVSGEEMTFSAPLPDYFENVLNKLRDTKAKQ